jgi:hypothetical protein
MGGVGGGDAARNRKPLIPMGWRSRTIPAFWFPREPLLDKYDMFI